MSELTFRKATLQDARIYFDWANDDDVRLNAHSSEKILWDDHVKWFSKRVASDNALLYIFFLETIPVGQIRIDISEGVGVIDYSVDRLFRGQGIGLRMITSALDRVRGMANCRVLHATVKARNTASERAFLKAGFRYVSASNINGVDCKNFEFALHVS